jgi:hypothetical protein
MVKLAGDGVPLFYTSILLLALSWITFVTRVGVRLSRKAFGLDDWLMFSGLVRVQQASHSCNAITSGIVLIPPQLLYTVTASLCIVCCFLGSGQLAAALQSSDIVRGTKVCLISLNP